MAESKGYRIILGERHLTLPLAQEIARNFSGQKELNLDAVFLLPPLNKWSCLLGLDTLGSPKLIYASELVNMLECDALDCGYDDGISWWYVLYQKGTVIDRFDSNPVDSYYDRAERSRDLKLYLEPFDPTDVREMYRKSMDPSALHVRFPEEVLSAYEGHPDKIPFVFTDQVHKDEIEPILRKKMHPESAFNRFCRALSLPYAGSFSSIDLFDELQRLTYEDASRPSGRPAPEVVRLIDKGLMMALFQHY